MSSGGGKELDSATFDMEFAIALVHAGWTSLCIFHILFPPIEQLAIYSVTPLKDLPGQPDDYAHLWKFCKWLYFFTGKRHVVPRKYPIAATPKL